MVSTIKIGPADDEQKTKRQKIINKLLWLFGTARNAILLVICGIFGYWINNADPNHTAPFKQIGYIPAGLPSFQIPKFSLSANESSTGHAESFIAMVSSYGSGLIVLPLLGLMENIAICKAFGKSKSYARPQLRL